ncbi:MAG: hypothetical protein ACK5O1_07800 [Holosporales bacterium]|jgi:hypothetical protein
MPDIANNYALRAMINPAVVNVTTTSASVDLQLFRASEFIAYIGTPGVTLSASILIDFVLQESDNNTTFTTVADADMYSTALPVANAGIFARIDANTKASRVYGIGYRGSRRYVRVVATYTGTHTVGTPIAVLATLGFASFAPVV